MRVVHFGMSYVNCTFSTANVLAICTGDWMMRIFDTKSWDIVFERKFGMAPRSVHLTEDLKFLTVCNLYIQFRAQRDWKWFVLVCVDGRMWRGTVRGAAKQMNMATAQSTLSSFYVIFSVHPNVLEDLPSHFIYLYICSLC